MQNEPIREKASTDPTRARRTARNPTALADAGLVERELVPQLKVVAERFSVAMTNHLIDLVDLDNPTDPIARQFVPSLDELETAPKERLDPIGDEEHSPVPGVIHRYPDRVLLKPVHVCPVYCRFCFRREFVGPGSGVLSPAEMDRALAYIKGNKKIWEVILTGGDPMVMSPDRIARLIRRLDAIDHVEVLRIHTRVPVVEPDRVNADMVDALRVETPVYVAIHCNHANEISPEMKAACDRLVNGGIPLLSQSVLLRGINDTPEALEKLFRRLVRLRIKPYYLHHGDLAVGTGHFRTSIEDGQQLMHMLRGRMSGLCQPTYVFDIPGGHGKSPIGPVYIAERGPGQYTVTDYNGVAHAYSDSERREL